MKNLRAAKAGEARKRLLACGKRSENEWRARGDRLENEDRDARLFLMCLFNGSW